MAIHFANRTPGTSTPHKYSRVITLCAKIVQIRVHSKWVKKWILCEERFNWYGCASARIRNYKCGHWWPSSLHFVVASWMPLCCPLPDIIHNSLARSCLFLPSFLPSKNFLHKFCALTMCPKYVNFLFWIIFIRAQSVPISSRIGQSVQCSVHLILGILMHNIDSNELQWILNPVWILCPPFLQLRVIQIICLVMVSVTRFCLGLLIIQSCRLVQTS